jgi:acyl-CoA synthetase (AMP-forming)/AMP-acid ligase II
VGAGIRRDAVLLRRARGHRGGVHPDGWLRTGDIGVLDAGGNLRITDRIKDMFIVGGFNAYPAEIENLMSRHPDVAQVAVVGVSDERLGEVGFAYVIPRQGSAPTAAELIAWCRGAMANFKVPRRVELVPALPLNPSGKALKFELRDRARKSAHQPDQLKPERSRRHAPTCHRQRGAHGSSARSCDAGLHLRTQLV